MNLQQELAKLYQQYNEQKGAKGSTAADTMARIKDLEKQMAKPFPTVSGHATWDAPPTAPTPVPAVPPPAPASTAPTPVPAVPPPAPASTAPTPVPAAQQQGTYVTRGGPSEGKPNVPVATPTPPTSPSPPAPAPPTPAPFPQAPAPPPQASVLYPSAAALPDTNPMGSALALFDTLQGRLGDVGQIDPREVQARAGDYAKDLNPALALIDQQMADLEKQMRARYGGQATGGLHKQIMEQSRLAGLEKARMAEDAALGALDRSREDVAKNLGLREGRFQSGLQTGEQGLNRFADSVQRELQRIFESGEAAAQREFAGSESEKGRIFTSGEAAAARDAAKNLANQQGKAETLQTILSPLLQGLGGKVAGSLGLPQQNSGLPYFDLLLNSMGVMK